MALLGIRVFDFYEMTLGQVLNALNAYYQRENMLAQERWEQMRNIMWAVLSPYSKKGQELTPRKVFAFPWDSDGTSENDGPDRTQMTPEELKAEWEEQQAKWAEVDRKRQQKINAEASN